MQKGGSSSKDKHSCCSSSSKDKHSSSSRSSRGRHHPRYDHRMVRWSTHQPAVGLAIAAPIRPLRVFGGPGAAISWKLREGGELRLLRNRFVVVVVVVIAAAFAGVLAAFARGSRAARLRLEGTIRHALHRFRHERIRLRRRPWHACAREAVEQRVCEEENAKSKTRSATKQRGSC